MTALYAYLKMVKLLPLTKKKDSLVKSMIRIILLMLLAMDFLNLNNQRNDSYWNYRDSKIGQNQDYEKQF